MIWPGSIKGFGSLLLLFCVPLLADAQTEILRIIEDGERGEHLLKVSSQGKILLSQTVDTNVSFFLSDVDYPTERKLIFVGKQKQRPSPLFSEDGRFVHYLMKEGDLWTVSIYDVSTGITTVLKDNTQHVATASKSATNGKIVYQVRDAGEQELPRLLLAEGDGTNARFLTNGVGESWSPDGRWILLQKPIGDETSIGVSRKKAKTSSGSQLEWKYVLFSAEGEVVLDLAGFDRPRLAKWSPDSKHIVIRVKNDPGFWIVSLREEAGKLEIDASTYTTAEGDSRVELRNPVWSPDGKRIAYIKSFLNESGNSYQGHEIWTLSIDKDSNIKLLELDAVTEIDVTWSSNETILFTKVEQTHERSVSVNELFIGE